MDTSKQYIEMCDCPEIQPEGRSLEDGDYFVRVGIAPMKGQYEVKVYHKHDFQYPEVTCYRIVWLPRQDQWQEMSGLNVWQWGFKFSEWLYDLDDDGDCDFHVRHIHEDLRSHEQLAAGFVMEEKCDKVWNGKWVDRV